VIQGEIGLGKTLITQNFGQLLLKSAKKRNINLKFIHINCRKEKTCYKVIHQILTQLGCPVPQRGYSPQDLFYILSKFLQTENLYVLLALDELHYLDTKNFDLVYSICRLNETNSNEKQFVSLIVIVKDMNLVQNLDNSTISSLQGNILTLRKYSYEQIFDILVERIKISIKDGAFSMDLIKFIAENIVESGDIRKGLAIIRNSVKIAEIQDDSRIKLEYIQNAVDNLIPTTQEDSLNFLNHQQLVLLKSIILSIERVKKNQVQLSEIRQDYEYITQKYGIEPLANTQLWENIQYLKENNIIRADVVSKNPKGRSSLISIKSSPIHILENQIDEKLRVHTKNFN